MIHSHNRIQHRVTNRKAPGPKYVYLFELDSVRKTPEEIILGQKALYDEIMINGNVVVLTFNQLIDSAGFFSLLADEEYYDSLIRLFDIGAIKISQYGDIRTLTQYLIDSTEFDKKFIYSGWPLKYTQRRLVAMIRRSLIYSDLSELYGYINGSHSRSEIEELFLEVPDEKSRDSGEQQLTFLQMQTVLKKLYWLLKTVMTLSSMHTIYISPRKAGEYKNLKLSNIIDIVCGLKSDNDSWDPAVEIIRKLPCYSGEGQGIRSNSRSEYLHQIFDAYKKESGSNRQKSYQYAEAIVNICYLYACEISIRNISKHYNAEELIGNVAPYPSFEEDFFKRLNETWGAEGSKLAKTRCRRFLQEDTNNFSEYTGKDEIKNLQNAAYIIRYLHTNKSGRIAADTGRRILRYEDGYEDQCIQHKKSLQKSIRIKLVGMIFCFVIVWGIAIALQYVQDLFDTVFLSQTVWGNAIRRVFNTSEGKIIGTALEILIFLILSEYVTNLLSGIITRWRADLSISLSTVLGDTVRLLRNEIIVKTGMSSSHLNISDEMDYMSEKNNEKENPVTYVIPKPLKRYMDFKKKGQYKDLFSYSSVYDFVDLNPEGISEVMKEEELHGRQFGIIYQSEFNVFCVDPIRDVNGKITSYERIIPAAGNGDVIVPVHNGKLVLLYQYRHAPRKMQYAFPRGHAEPGMPSAENAKKELDEELIPKIKGKPIYIGSISPDSGLASTCASVYTVELESYDRKSSDTDPSGKPYEGIKKVVELTPDEFETWIDKNAAADNTSPEINKLREFDDGYTIAAYELYKRYLYRNKKIFSQ